MRSESNGVLTYLGVGEDRAADLAHKKAQAMAWQDLANECSLIPNGAKLDPAEFEENVGVISRAYARVSVPMDLCSAARQAVTAATIRAQSDASAAAEVARYQRDYDPPEPLERTPGKDTDSITEYFSARQRIALRKQDLVLGAPWASDAGLAAQARALDAYVTTHAEVAHETHAFSERRANMIAHQAAAVRDTVAVRQRLQSEYPPQKLPEVRHSAPFNGGRGGGRRRRGMPSPTPAPESVPSPIPPPPANQPSPGPS